MLKKPINSFRGFQNSHGDDFMSILKRDNPQNAIIFCRSRVGTDTLYDAMLAEGYKVEAIHGGLTRAKREDVMAKFRNNKINY